MYAPSLAVGDQRGPSRVRRAVNLPGALLSLTLCMLPSCAASPELPPTSSANSMPAETAAPADSNAASGGGGESSNERGQRSAPMPASAERAADPNGDHPNDGSPGTGERVATGDPRALMDKARSQLLELGQSGWTDVRTSAADVLDTLAALTASLDVEQRLKPKVAEMRFQAKRLRRTESFVQAAWIARALNAALDGLEGLQCSQPADAWLRAARRSVDAIEDQTTLSFQHASVQDAFRATVDAFVAANEPGSSCARSARTAGG